jgi:branched-chain amino acid transport system ATP-binding protein
MARGRLIADGDPQAIRNNPQVVNVYFGSGRSFAGTEQSL